MSWSPSGDRRPSGARMGDLAQWDEVFSPSRTRPLWDVCCVSRCAAAGSVGRVFPCVVSLC